MCGMKIPLAFYTAVRGYSWHCANGRISENDLSLIEERLFSGNDMGIHPTACVFSCGDRVFFFRHLKAVNFDFNMRSADYYVVGSVQKHEASRIDFRWIFENEVFARPIGREEAMAGKFPSYLNYAGGHAAARERPSVDCPDQLDVEVLSSIGNWIEREDGDLVVYIADDIARPTLEVKIERKPEVNAFNISECSNESKGPNEREDSNESGAAAFEILESQQASKNEEEEPHKKLFLGEIWSKIRSMFGLRRPVEGQKGIDGNGYKVIPELRDSTKMEKYSVEGLRVRSVMEQD